MKSHEITAIVEGQEVSGWQSGNIDTGMLSPADTFVMRINPTELAWRTLRRDARIVIKADGITLLTGIIGKRRFHGGRSTGLIEISGRDLCGRLVDESAPKINYTGMLVTDAIRELIHPWFDRLTLSNARNRRLRVGKGKRVASGTEPVVTINVRVPRRGQVHPGEKRWQIIHEILSRAGMIGWASADGSEFFIGKPNQTQDAQYLFALGAPEGKIETTVEDLEIIEDDEDRYSMIMCGGVGGQSDTNYGKNIIDNRGVVFDNVFNRVDGTGRDFIHPKRMYMPERAFDSYRDAQRVAQNEQNRLDYKRHMVSVEMPGFGQYLETDEASMFMHDTVARVIVEELGIDDRYLVTTASLSFSRDQGDRTTMHAVPVGTEIPL